MPNPDKSIYFERRTGALGRLEQYAPELELRIERLVDRIKTASGGHTTNITNIVGGSTLGTATPEDVSLSAASVGTSAYGAHEDHVHFLDEDALFALHTITAGAGLTGGGALDTNPTIDIVAADNTITVNADSIQANIPELESQLDQNLAEVLIVGNSAGSTDIDMNGQAVRNAGYLEDNSASPATTGVLRTGNNVTMASARTSGGANALVMVFGSTNNLFLGDTTNVNETRIQASGTIRLFPTGAVSSEYDFTNASLQMNNNNLDMEGGASGGDILQIGDSVQFDINSEPVIDQETATSGDGADMIVRSQQVTSNGTGGDLRLIGGNTDGENPGASVTIENGTGNVTADYATSQINFYASLSMNGNDIREMGQLIQDSGEPAPGLTQTGVSGAGANMLVQAQGSSAGTAGNLILASGDGVTDGALVFRIGATEVARFDINGDLDVSDNNLLDFGYAQTGGFTVAGLPSLSAATSGIAVVTNASTGYTVCVWNTTNWIDLQTGSTVTT